MRDQSSQVALRSSCTVRAACLFVVPVLGFWCITKNKALAFFASFQAYYALHTLGNETLPFSIIEISPANTHNCMRIQTYEVYSRRGDCKEETHPRENGESENEVGVEKRIQNVVLYIQRDTYRR